MKIIQHEIEIDVTEEKLKHVVSTNEELKYNSDELEWLFNELVKLETDTENIVCERRKGLSDEELDNLYKTLKRYKKNIAIEHNKLPYVKTSFDNKIVLFSTDIDLPINEHIYLKSMNYDISDGRPNSKNYTIGVKINTTQKLKYKTHYPRFIERCAIAINNIFYNKYQANLILLDRHYLIYDENIYINEECQELEIGEINLKKII
jgi:hypothetical protein